MYLKFKKYTLVFSLIILLLYLPLFIAPKIVDSFYNNFISYSYRAFLWGTIKYSYKISENLHINYIKYNINNSYLSNKRYAYSRDLFLRNFESYNKQIYGNVLYEIADLIFKNNDRDIGVFKKKIILSDYLKIDQEENLNLLFEMWNRHPTSFELSELFFEHYNLNKTECSNLIKKSFFGNEIDTLKITRNDSIDTLLKNNIKDIFYYDTLQSYRDQNDIYTFSIENINKNELIRIDFISSNKKLSNLLINDMKLDNIAGVLHKENISLNNNNLEILDLTKPSYIIITLENRPNSAYLNLNYSGDELFDIKKNLYCK